MSTHTEHITAGRHSYRIRIGGTLDGVNTRDPVGYKAYGQAFEPNRLVQMENLGESAVVNPWIVVNGKRDWRSIDRILDGILTDGMTDAEKARAIWEFARTHRYHYTSADDEVKDTVKMLNVYGYTLCWDEAYTVSNLWQAAGLKIRRGVPHGHCTTEVYYDGAYHLLDSDEHLLILLRDNRTVAGEADLSRDHDLMKRSHAYGPLQPESRTISEGGASLFFHTGPRSGGRPFIGGRRMDLTLRPGEALIWEWKDRGKYHGQWDRPPRLANGRIRYTPDLSPEGFARWAKTAEHIAAGQDADGSAVLHPTAAGENAFLVYRIESPYVIVGGNLEFALCRSNAQDAIGVDVSCDGEHWETVWTAEGTGDLTETVSLDTCLSSGGPARYAYDIRVRLHASNSPDDVALKRLSLETDLQMAPLSLPALEVGDNDIRYTSDTDGPQQIRITHAWQEKDAGPPPQPPRTPLFPADGADVSGTQFTFRWTPVDSAQDYHFQLGPRADMTYTLSPTFDKLTSKTPAEGKAEWRIPYEGLLNPGETYHWQVRVRNADGLWGPWSPVWRFTPQAPGVPLSVETAADWEDRTVTLRWRPNPNGQTPDHYEIHGSDERGFTASREPYPVVMGKGEDTATLPANLIATTRDTAVQVAGPDVADVKGNRAFYRVVAVAVDGVRSGPSDYAEAPRPMIVSHPLEQAFACAVYKYQIRAIRSIGDLRCESKGSQRYVSAFRDGDTLRFLLDEGPGWIALDAKTGLLTARPEAVDAGTHTVTVRVQNGQGGQDMQGFDLRVE